MKKIYFFILLTLCSFSDVFSQSSEINALDYFTLGFSAGVGSGKTKSGGTFGLFQYSAVHSVWILECSALKISNFNEGSSSSKYLFLDLFTFDAGIGGQLFNKLFLGFNPLSINLSQSPSFGVALFGKYKLLERCVLEAKYMPLSYNDLNEGQSSFTNNSYLGVQYWFSKNFCLGLRYNRYNYYKNYNLIFSWNLI